MDNDVTQCIDKAIAALTKTKSILETDYGSVTDAVLESINSDHKKIQELSKEIATRLSCLDYHVSCHFNDLALMYDETTRTIYNERDKLYETVIKLLSENFRTEHNWIEHARLDKVEKLVEANGMTMRYHMYLRHLHIIKQIDGVDVTTRFWAPINSSNYNRSGQRIASIHLQSLDGE